MRRCPRSSMLRRVAGSVCFVTALIGMPPARAEAPAAPVLWEGTVQSSDGAPAAGTEVLAFARPPADQLGSGANQLVPVAQATTDSQGHYALRAGHSDALRAAEDDTGWVTVMVSAAGPAGSTMAIDTIAWQPRGGIRAAAAGRGDDTAGRWITTPAQQLAAQSGDGQFRATAADDAEAAAQDRPAVMVLRGGDPQDRRFSAQGAQGQGPDSGGCAGPTHTEDLGTRMVEVGELHLSHDWSGQFKYEQVRSTSFQIGVRQQGQWWSAGGSVGSLKGTSLSHENPVLDQDHTYRYSAQMIFKRFTWICNFADVREVDTVEPVEWTGGMERSDNNLPPGCNPKFEIPVVPNDVVKRKIGASTTIEGGVSVAGFQGSATETIAKGAEQTWVNKLPNKRYLCGESALPTRHTRVQSIA